VGVAECVGRHPLFSDSGAVAGTGKQTGQRRIGQWVPTICASPAYEENERSFGIVRPFMHDVCVQYFQGVAIVQIDYALDTGLRSHALWMIIAAADEEATTPVAYICQLQSKNLPRA
jgi:hypothetical protein